MEAPARTPSAVRDSLRVARDRPRIGVLGIMQELYDKMLPGITERQDAYLRELASKLGDTIDAVVAPAARTRDDIEREVAQLQLAGVEGLLVVNLTYGPGLRWTRTATDTTLPICLANVQPEADVTEAWDMADLTYNQGIHGIQDTANA